jgi:hypothetical protein
MIAQAERSNPYHLASSGLDDNDDGGRL